MTPHFILVQSAHSDLRLSQQRLAITQTTVIPALASQTRKPIVRLMIHESDPLLTERLEAFRSTGCEIQPVPINGEFRLNGNDWKLPSGRKVISRVDDDDSLCKEFCETIYAASEGRHEICLLWPRGYVFWRDNLYILNHPRNQFPTLVTETQETPHDKPHVWYHDNWKCETVATWLGWIWIRHGIAMSSTRRKYRPVKVRGIQADRFAINLRAVARAIAPCGLPSASYAEHREMRKERGIEYPDMIKFGQ
jgi:hypothetical protein